MIITQQKIAYKDLNSRQQESRNFLKVAAKLDEYGFEVLRTHNDYNGADMIATNMDGTVLQIQLKTCANVAKGYIGKGLKIAYIDRQTGDVLLYDHDEVLQAAIERGAVEGTATWELKGKFHWPRRIRWMEEYVQIL